MPFGDRAIAIFVGEWFGARARIMRWDGVSLS